LEKSYSYVEVVDVLVMLCDEYFTHI